MRFANKDSSLLRKHIETRITAEHGFRGHENIVVTKYL